MTKDNKKHIDFIVNTVCEYYELNRSDVLSNLLKSEYSHARQMIVYILRIKTESTYREIAQVLNRKTSTLIKSFYTMTNKLSSSNCNRIDLNAILKIVDENKLFSNK